MFKLMGYERKTGSFPNKQTGEVVEYDNYVLHYQTDEKKGVKGLYCDNADAKAENLIIAGAKSIDECIGKEVALVADLTAKTDNEGKARIQISKILVLG